MEIAPDRSDKPTFNVDLITTNSQQIHSHLITTYPKRFTVVDNDATQASFDIYRYHYKGGACITALYKENNETYYSYLGVNKE